jgi:hypothetical protein
MVLSCRGGLRGCKLSKPPCRKRGKSRIWHLTSNYTGAVIFKSMGSLYELGVECAPKLRYQSQLDVEYALKLLYQNQLEVE